MTILQRLAFGVSRILSRPFREPGEVAGPLDRIAATLKTRDEAVSSNRAIQATEYAVQQARHDRIRAAQSEVIRPALARVLQHLQDRGLGAGSLRTDETGLDFMPRGSHDSSRILFRGQVDGRIQVYQVIVSKERDLIRGGAPGLETTADVYDLSYFTDASVEGLAWKFAERAASAKPR